MKDFSSAKRGLTQLATLVEDLSFTKFRAVENIEIKRQFFTEGGQAFMVDYELNPTKTGKSITATIFAKEVKPIIKTVTLDEETLKSMAKPANAKWAVLQFLAKQGLFSHQGIKEIVDKKIAENNAKDALAQK